MNLITRNLYYIINVIVFISVISCTSVKEVSFKTPVDTNTKPIVQQKKQTYYLKDVGVYASNEFDGARINGFIKANDSTAIVVINPENTPINMSPYYAFKTWSTSAKPFYFQFQYPEGNRHRYIPKIEIDGEWQILDSSKIFKKEKIITIKLDLKPKPIIVAAQEVNSSTDVKNWYTKQIIGKGDYVRVKSVGKSTLGKNLPVLDIYKGDKKNKDVIVLLTRQHPPEVTGYYAFQGFLQYILNDSELSQRFLSKYRILAFPIMNPDGVDLGHWRHNAGGVDTNRDWSLYKQPEIKQVVKFIDKTLKKNKVKLILGLDFHSTFYDVFYTNKTREGTARPDFIQSWFKELEQGIPNYKVNESSSNSTKPVSKGWFLYGHNAVGITYEIGDTTPKKRIKVISEVSAEQMMKILLKN